MTPADVAAVLFETTGARAETLPARNRRIDADAQCVLVPEKAGRALLRRVREQVGPGWQAFLGRMYNDGDMGADEQVELIVAPGDEALDMVRWTGTEGTKYDLDTEGIVKAVSKLHAEHGIEILHCERDQVTVRFTHDPGDWRPLADHLAELCPDLILQGFDDEGELAEFLAEEREVTLWWD
jgi:hypothetical protein